MTETIEYERTRIIREQGEFKIKDIDNCFLRGASNYSNIVERLGVYKKGYKYKIIEIQTIDALKVAETEVPLYFIKKFLVEHNRVEEIKKEEFEKRLNKILKLLEE